MRQPLVLLLLRLLRFGLLFCAGTTVLFFVIEVGKQWASGALHRMSFPDYGFLPFWLWFSGRRSPSRA